MKYGMCFLLLSIVLLLYAPQRGGWFYGLLYMYREKPDDSGDSGWRFFSGYESDEYVNDPKNLGIYDVNTIANYDPDIIPFLDAPVNSAFARHKKTGLFVKEDFASE